MSEEKFRQPPLRSIPVRDKAGRETLDEQKVISLINALKENIEVKQQVLRQDIKEDLQAEVGKLEDSSKDLLKANQGEIAQKFADLEEKFNASQSGNEIAELREEYNSQLGEFKAMMEKFDLTLFINEIRGAFAAQLKMAEEKAETMAMKAQEYERKLQELKELLAEKEQQIQRWQKEAETTRRPSKAKSAPIQPLERAKTIPVTPQRPIPTTSPTPDYLNTETPTGDSQKPVMFCKNCGKPRSRNTARFCVYCGGEF